MTSVKIIECPRDAMQGIHDFINTSRKISYLNTLLKAGFDTLDCGSFVSAKAIPQLADTAEVLQKIDYASSNTKLLAIVANNRGGDTAATFEQITYMGFPLSLSETFQQRNTNSSIVQAFDTVFYLQNLCEKHGKQLVVYFSMGFGNPYGDPWNAETVLNWVERLHKAGIRIISLADTVGLAAHDDIRYIFSHLIPAYADIEFGAHFHARPDNWKIKLEAAWESGCRRFDGAIKGYGGCPMANDSLVGNMPTEHMLDFFNRKQVNHGVDEARFAASLVASSSVFA